MASHSHLEIFFFSLFFSFLSFFPFLFSFFVKSIRYPNLCMLNPCDQHIVDSENPDS